MARGGFAAGFAGFLIGVVTGLGIAAGAAVFIMKSPVPFVNKVDKVTADVDPSEALKGGVDPNARLNQNSHDAAAESAAGEVKTVTVEDSKSAESARPAAVTYWLQTSRFASQKEAESTLGQLALMGIEGEVARVNSDWYVRVGPFERKAAANEVRLALTDQGLRPTLIEQK